MQSLHVRLLKGWSSPWYYSGNTFVTLHAKIGYIEEVWEKIGVGFTVEDTLEDLFLLRY